MVYLGDDQPPPARTVEPDAGFSGEPMQSLESLTVHQAVADDHSPSKKRKISFIEPISELEGNAKELGPSQSLPNSEVPPEVATIDVISVDSDEVHETRGDPTQPPKELKSSRKKMEVVIIDRVTSSETRSAKGRISNSEIVVQRAKGMFLETSTLFCLSRCASEHDPKLTASTSSHETSTFPLVFMLSYKCSNTTLKLSPLDSKGKTKNPGPSENLTEPPDETQSRQETRSSSAVEGLYSFLYSSINWLIAVAKATVH